MNKSKITEYDYINFLIGTQLVYRNTEAEQVCPHEKDGAAHDAYTRQLHRLIPTTERLWSEARKHIDLNKGVLIIDDSTLDKFYNQKIEIISMLQTACQRRFQPEFVLFDSWYTSLENLKIIRSFSWQWLTSLEHNRHVNPDRTKNIPIHQVDIPQAGCLVHLNIQDRDIE